MGLPAGDINALLANLRFRLDRRLRAAGLRLVWRVDALPALPWCGSGCMRHIQYILMEAISNAMQHAEATTLTMAAVNDGGAIVIELSDDGAGLNGEKGNGLRSMHERAALIPATLVLEPAQPGLRVRLRLPVVPSLAS
jgi:hypothetical protein